MKKRLAVLLLRIAGAPDNPSKAYADRLFTAAGRGTRNLVDYYDDMTHGRLDLGDSRVFEWIDYGHTTDDLMDEWTKAKVAKKEELEAAGMAEGEAEIAAQGHAHRVRRGKIVTWAREAAAANGYDLSGFDLLVCVFNQPVDYFGSANGVVVQWYDATGHDRLSVDLTGVSHEVGHGLGLQAHSRLEDSDAEYADPWDVMSAYSGFHDLSGTATPPGSPYYTFGPGLNAVNMELLDGLDPVRVFQSAGTSSTFTLRPLHRRDLSGWLAAKVQIGYETLYVEFRLREGWDASIPAACVLLHRHAVTTNGEACSELVVGMPTIRAELLEGDSYEAGEVADPFGLYARITATRLDVEAREAMVDVYVRSPRRAPQARPFGGVTRDGGGFIWVPGRGVVPVPPRSPLLEIVELLAEYETLQGLSRGPDTHALALDRLVRARDQLAGLVERRTAPKVPAPPLRRRTE